MLSWQAKGSHVRTGVPSSGSTYTTLTGGRHVHEFNAYIRILNKSAFLFYYNMV